MTKVTRTYDPAEYKLVPLKCPYRSRLALAIVLGLDDQEDKERLEAAWARAIKASFDECGEDANQKMRMPTLDEAMYFIAENPGTAAKILEAMQPINIPPPPEPPPVEFRDGAIRPVQSA